MQGGQDLKHTLETSVPGDHAGNGLAERAVGLVGGMVRTLKNELEFICQMQIPPESKTIAWIIGHAATLLNLDTVGSDGKVPFERWRGRGHRMGRCVFGQRVGPLTDRTKAEDMMESGTFVGFRMMSSECILIASGEATTARTIQRRLGPTLRRSSAYRPGHGTDVDPGKKRQFDPWESGVNPTPNWTKHPSPSRLMKRNRRST